MILHLDTHAVELEVQYLYEVGRITVEPGVIFTYLADRVALSADDTPFVVVTRVARTPCWARDPFDRLITATAMASHQPLLTRDYLIRDNHAAAFWDDP